jgi:hypothetical protein
LPFGVIGISSKQVHWEQNAWVRQLHQLKYGLQFSSLAISHVMQSAIAAFEVL